MRVKDLVVKLLESNPNDSVIIEIKKETKNIKEVNIIKHLKLVVLK